MHTAGVLYYVESVKCTCQVFRVSQIQSILLRVSLPIGGTPMDSSTMLLIKTAS
jgi:hypothetical protein